MLGAPARRAAPARGGVAGMVFQEPMTSLNPLHRIGRQVAEAMALHGRPADAADARRGPAAPGRASPTPSTGWTPSRTSCPAASGSG